MIASRLTKDGFSLVEITLALGVMAFCMIAIVGLLPVGFRTTQGSSQETLATDLVASIDADLRATPLTSSASPFFNISMTGETVFYVDDSGLTTTSSNARFRAYVKLSAPTSGTIGTTSGRVVASWPAQQDDLSKALGLVEVHIALDRN